MTSSPEIQGKDIPLVNKTLFFTSIKENSFDYSLPIKTGLNKFCSSPRAEASPSLFEYLCYKIVQKNISENNVNEEVAIISEKFLSSKNCKINIIKTKSIKKKFILIPIRNEISRKWNAVIFVHLERQIRQYMNQMNEEPIIAKIISSNINSEEDDYILNTTMDRIETSFNFTSPEDIQFEVDSINISDQPNTSVFLLNFIEGLINQKNNESIMDYIMKLYDETSNSNVGSNNYFISFNKENIIFNDLIKEYKVELDQFLKIKEKKEKDIKNSNNNSKIGEEEVIDSEEEALRIIAKENEEIRKQMEEQDLYFPLKNSPNYRLENVDLNNNMNMLGLIQEVENESDDDSKKKSNLNNKSLKLSKSFKIIENNNIADTNYESIKKNNNKIDNSQNTIKEVNKEESIELNNNKMDINYNNKEKDEESVNIIKKNELDKKNENIILNGEKNEEEKEKNIKLDDKKDIEDKNNININKININNTEQNPASICNTLNNNENDNDNNSFERLIIPSTINKTIDTSNNLQKNKNYVIENNNNCNNYNSVRDSCNSNNSNNSSVYERKKLSNYNNRNKRLSNNSKSNSEENIDKYKNYNIYISKNNYKVNIINDNNNNDLNNNIEKYINHIGSRNVIKPETYSYSKTQEKLNGISLGLDNGENKDNHINENNINVNNSYKNYSNSKSGKNKVNLPLVKKNILNKKDDNLIKDNNKNCEYNNNEIYDNNLNNNGNKKIDAKNINYNNINENKLNTNDYKKYKNNANTIIINETSNNSTVINFIEIKNNYEPSTKNKNKDKNKSKENNNNVISNKNQIWSINISGDNNIKLFSEKDDNDFVTHIPDDGTANRISTTLNPLKTITGINNKENLKVEMEEDDKINEEKINMNMNILTTNNINNISMSENKEIDEKKIDVNMLINTNRSKIQRKTTKNRKLRREKNSTNIGIIKDFGPDDCALNITKDLKCGCTGNVDNTCCIF